MADEFDLAQRREESDRETALARFRATLPSGLAAFLCKDCGDPIPKERRDAVAGCTRCIGCQKIFERGVKVFA